MQVRFDKKAAMFYFVGNRETDRYFINYNKNIQNSKHYSQQDNFLRQSDVWLFIFVEKN